MAKYGIYHFGKISNGWCSGYWTNPKSGLNYKSFVSDINDAYNELNEWSRHNGDMYEVKEVKE